MNISETPEGLNDSTREDSVEGSLQITGSSNVGIGVTNPSALLQMWDGSTTSDSTNLIINNPNGDWDVVESFNRANLTFMTEATPKRCPIHGDIQNTFNFNFPDHGVDETYCLICLSEMLRKVLMPLEEGGERKPEVKRESGFSISRYDIATGKLPEKKKEEDDAHIQ